MFNPNMREVHWKGRMMDISVIQLKNIEGLLEPLGTPDVILS